MKLTLEGLEVTSFITHLEPIGLKALAGGGSPTQNTCGNSSPESKCMECGGGIPPM